LSGTELFTTNRATTVVSSGGTTAPAGGTSESWTVVSPAGFPAAVTGVSQFHVADPSAPSEMIAVTNVSGTTWTVTRGAESTTPVAHAAGFTVYQVATAGALTQLRGVDWVNAVTQFGADPTGTADSTSAITTAIAALPAAGGVVYFPAGTYKTTGGHNVPLNVSIFGDGKNATTFNHRGVSTWCFFNGSLTGGANPPNMMGKFSGFTISGQSGGNGTGGFGTQVGVKILNCLFFHVEDIHFTLLYEGLLIDGGDEGALGAGTFAGNGYVSNVTSSNIYYALHIYRWVTDTTYSFCYGYGNSPVVAGSAGLWVDSKASTSTFLNPSYEGFDTGYLITTTQQSLTFLNPRVENCNTLVSFTGGTTGVTVIGANHASNWTGAASAVYSSPFQPSQLTGILTIYRQVSASATPSATLGTYGSVVTLAAEAGFTGFAPLLVEWTTSGLATETVTVQSVTTYSDNTTNTQTLTTASSNGTNSLSVNATCQLLSGGDGRIVRQVTFAIKSSISSSAASATFMLAGINLP
jgi:hypothetical protein